MRDEDWGPKYLNTKESLVFKKRNTLFGEALLPPRRHPATAVIVEGYFDVIRWEPLALYHKRQFIAWE